VLAPFDEILPRPGSGRPPVCAFTCYGLEAAVAVLQVAERRDAPVMLLVSSQTYRSALGRPLVRALRTLGEAASTPVAVQLDHVSNLGLIAAALDDIRARELEVLPICPFVIAFLDRHPDYRDLLRFRGERQSG